MKKNTFLSLYSLFAVALAAPIITLCFFSFPTVDDYSIAEKISRLGYFGAQIDSYVHWSGRFVPGILLCCIHPLLFHSLLLYRIIALSFVLGTFGALHVFIRRVLAPELKLSEQIAISLSIFVLYLYGAPSIVESFYWLPASLCYQLASITLLLLLSSIAGPAAHRPRRRTIVLCCIGALILAGSNESSGFSFLILSISCFLFKWRATRSPDLLIGAVIVSAMVGFAIDCLAPGNHVRAAEFHYEPHVLATMLLSVKLLSANIMTWCGNLMFFIVTLIAISLNINLMTSGFQTRNAPLHPAVSIFIYLAVLQAVFVPAASVIGHMPPLRVLNYAYVLFLAGWFLNVRIAVRWSLSRLSTKASPLPRYALGFLFILSIAALFQHNNIRTAYGDIIKGKAAAYSRQMSERDKSIRESSQDTVTLDTIITRPRSLYFGDITAAPDSWQNRPYAYYYGKKAIRLKCPYKGEYIF